LSSGLILAGISWIFLVKSTLPSFNFLSDFGIREFSGLVFFSLFAVSELEIVAASLFIWIINVMIPSIFGLTFVMKIRANQWWSS
jgi:hypothetical protein